MSAPGQAVLLIGSPRGGRSTSAQLGEVLVAGLKKRGWTATTHVARTAIANTSSWSELERAAAAAELVIVATPLYVDSLPAPLIETFERLHALRRTATPPQAQRLIAVVNSGFPEASQNDTALAICRCFARRAGFHWDGGLALGMGGALSGHAITEHGRTHAVAAALHRAADELAAGGPLSAGAIQALARPMMPVWLYRLIAEVSFRIAAWRYGTRHLGARPYAREDD
jgi:hypothetical protein